jgi:hypothetical protein
VNRKELKDSYKLNPPAIGIYCITNLVTKQVLLGASMNLDGILNRHRFGLAQGLHENKPLQGDWREYGADNFTFEAIDTVKPRTEPGFDPRAELDALHKMWQAEYVQRGAIFYK